MALRHFEVIFDFKSVTGDDVALTASIMTALKVFIDDSLRSSRDSNVIPGKIRVKFQMQVENDGLSKPSIEFNLSY